VVSKNIPNEILYIYIMYYVGTVPFIVGGGNDQSYPNASALLAKCVQDQKYRSIVLIYFSIYKSSYFILSVCGRTLLVVNIDAHLDVRPLKQQQVHSGSPFRLMLEGIYVHIQRFLEIYMCFYLLLLFEKILDFVNVKADLWNLHRMDHSVVWNMWTI
jgi:hypothetical protein